VANNPSPATKRRMRRTPTVATMLGFPETTAIKRAALGVDVGGSFTDVVCSTETRTVRAKAPTDPQDIGAGVVAACEKAAAQLGVSLDQLLPHVTRFGLGTTAVTNALTAHDGLKVGLLTTQGFETLALTARGDRISRDGWLELPWVPIEQSCIVGLPERLDRDGHVLAPLNVSEAAAAARHLVDDEGVEALAISFLWSYVNPVHEELTAEVVRRLYPNLPVFCGAALQPVRREYERTMVAVMNAFCANVLDGIEQLEQRLKSLGLRAPLLLLQASGGTATVPEARRAPLRLAASGPAAGVAAAAELARTQLITEAVCGDVGGTSFDVAVIVSGQPVRSHRSKLHGVAVAQSHVDVESVGSGGGSIGWIDRRGMLRVGPRSARSTPGPACYGRGGTEATITDALLLLGYIEGETFLGGAMRLDRDAAMAACAALGAQVGLDAMATAWAIRETALADMVSAMRSLVSANGLKAKDLSAVAYGGGGPLFMAAVSHAVGIPRLLSPALASVLSAFGGGSADVRLERSRAIGCVLPMEPGLIDRRLSELRRLVTQDLDANGVAAEAQEVRFEADVQFLRQSTDLTLGISIPFEERGLTEAFFEAYTALYGEGTVVDGAKIELVSIRAVGIGSTDRVRMPVWTGAGATAPPPVRGDRLVWLSPDAAERVPVYEAAALLPGHHLQGPALVDAVDNTLWVPPGSTGSVDAFNTITLELGAD
jgi:N-methylhydantoinase A